VTTTSEASTAPSYSCKDGTFERSNDSMEHKDDALLGSAVGPVVISSPPQDNSHEISRSTKVPDAVETPEYLDESEDPFLISSYTDIPALEQTKLPRGGVSVETSAVGRVQVCC
jgi:hypothetical protein